MEQQGQHADPEHPLLCQWGGDVIPHPLRGHLLPELLLQRGGLVQLACWSCRQQPNSCTGLGTVQVPDDGPSVHILVVAFRRPGRASRGCADVLAHREGLRSQLLDDSMAIHC